MTLTIFVIYWMIGIVLTWMVALCPNDFISNDDKKDMLLLSPMLGMLWGVALIIFLWSTLIDYVLKISREE